MGLDMRAYENAELVPEKLLPEDEDERYDSFAHVWLNGNFPAEIGLVGGWYKTSGESFSWRAGSYSGYNQFRRMLAEMFDDRTDEDYWYEDADPTWPFFELINYSDCEGAMGPQAIQNVGADFTEYAGLWTATYGGRMDWDWMNQKYAEWTKGTTIAKHGLIIFA